MTLPPPQLQHGYFVGNSQRCPKTLGKKTMAKEETLEQVARFLEPSEFRMYLKVVWNSKKPWIYLNQEEITSHVTLPPVAQYAYNVRANRC